MRFTALAGAGSDCRGVDAPLAPGGPAEGTPARPLAPTDPLSPAERKAFRLPPGFEAQLVASEPDIQKPMKMAFDAKGRLWVTTSHHYPFAAPQGRRPTRCTSCRTSIAATGKARKVQTFASDLNIPIGVLPLPDCKSAIVSSIGRDPEVLTDTDGDGKADKTRRCSSPASASATRTA